ncbi:MAG: hypothetical protein JKY08_09005 [Flavobacteriaceae bacterium]|nr:hypothetical protein [Flavobacteriaceae bacterium]
MNRVNYQNISVEQQSILVKTYFGEFTCSEIIESWKSAIKKGLFKTNTARAILDFRDAHLHINLKSDIEKLTAYFSSEPTYFRNKKFAIIMTEPQQVTIPIILEKNGNIFISKVFYSLDAGKYWILK